MVNVGTLGYCHGVRVAAGTSSTVGGPEGGACVVVRGRESRPHGEGGQRIRSAVTVMPGGHL